MNTVIEEDIQHILAAPLPWERLKGKTILVTGVGGMIGGYCARVAERMAFTTKVGREHIYTKYSPHDFVIHAASPASPKDYCADPVGTIKANTIATENLLKSAKEGFLFLSSGESSLHLDTLDIRSCYGESKRMGEVICKAWWTQYHALTKIARISHTYGPGMRLDDGRVFADFTRDILNGGPIVMHSDGSARRPFLYLADAVEGIFTILLKGEPGEAYNLANPYQDASIAELANRLSLLFHVPVERQDRGFVPSSIQGPMPEISGLESLGWAPSTTIEEGFKRTVTSYRESFKKMADDFYAGIVNESIAMEAE